MEKRDEAAPKSRRKFLKSMALTGGGVSVAVAMGQTAATENEVEGRHGQDEPTGYHETQHIRDYYAKAQF
ncbi:MAG TPA: hypothetical protein PK725_16375 [Rhodocyclaceae bacterium]|nr:hypothetical protein [Rhodocyclaceae bacterium]